MSHRAVRAALLSLALLTLGAPARAGGGAPAARPPSAACRDGLVRPDFAALNRQLRSARARWRAAAIPDYRYDLREIAAPVRFPDTRVTVRRGVAVSVGVLAGQPGTPGPRARMSVEQRFDDIARTLAGQRTQPCPEVRVAYDPQRGFPIYLYSGLGDAGIADGFGEWTVSNFRPGR